MSIYIYGGMYFLLCLPVFGWGKTCHIFKSRGKSGSALEPYFEADSLDSEGAVAVGVVEAPACLSNPPFGKHCLEVFSIVCVYGA